VALHHRVRTDAVRGAGLKKQGTTSDHWLDDFYNWLEAQGLTKR